MIENMGTRDCFPSGVMVLVTDQFHCRRLITAGRQLADRTGVPLEVVNVTAPGAEHNPEAMEFLFQASRENNASMTIHYSAHPEHFLGELIRERCPTAVVTGLPGTGSTLLQRLWMRFEETPFYLVDHDGSLHPVTIADRTGFSPLSRTALLPPPLRLAEQ